MCHHKGFPFAANFLFAVLRASAYSAPSRRQLRCSKRVGHFPLALEKVFGGG